MIKLQVFNALLNDRGEPVLVDFVSPFDILRFVASSDHLRQSLVGFLTHLELLDVKLLTTTFEDGHLKLYQVELASGVRISGEKMGGEVANDGNREFLKSGSVLDGMKRVGGMSMLPPLSTRPDKRRA